MVNGKRVMAPSYKVEPGDVVTVRAASFKKPVFAKYDEKMKEVKVPSWLSYDIEKKAATVSSAPKYVPGENVFDLGVVVEFYSR
jgi:small subunit ribosomal protein S4